MGKSCVLETIEITSGRDPEACILWLHGLGADGGDFVPVAESLSLPFPVRYVFPHAPIMPVTVNGGYQMRAWYDIYSLDIAGQQDETGIRSSQKLLEGLIDQQKAQGIAPSNILIAGFSQGGAIALQTGLRYPDRLAGIMALSTYLPMATALASESSAQNRNLPVFMAHGTFDTVIPVAAAEMSRDLLQALGYPVEWRQYPMAHSVSAEEISDIRQFLMETLNPGKC